MPAADPLPSGVSTRRPEAARRGLRARTRVTFEGTIFSWFAVLFALAALLLHENLVLLMGCAALGCAQTARLLAGRNVRGLRFLRDLPSRGRVGVPLPITYGIENPRRRSAIGIQVEERNGPAVHPVTLSMLFTGVSGGQRVKTTTQLTFRRRGLHRLGAATVASRYPLGLFRASASADPSGQVLVRPQEGRPTSALRSWLGGSALAQRRPSLLRLGDDALHGVREFRDGDDPRRIHWRTTARRGTVTVTEWRREEGRKVVLLLGRGQGAGYRTQRTFERAVSAAATLWRASHRQGLDTQLDLGTEGGVRRGAPHRRFGAGLDALATVRAQGGRRPRAALKRLSHTHGSRIVIYVASGKEPGIRRRLARAAGRGGSWLLLRADAKGLSRWVRGL